MDMFIAAVYKMEDYIYKQNMNVMKQKFGHTFFFNDIVFMNNQSNKYNRL